MNFNAENTKCKTMEVVSRVVTTAPQPNHFPSNIASYLQTAYCVLAHIPSVISFPVPHGIHRI